MSKDSKEDARTLSKADIVLHPVRFRILMTVSGRQMTTQQIVAALPDVAQASAYRHINKLVEGGILRIVEESPGRGSGEKVYALDSPDMELSQDEMAAVGYEDQIRYFTNFCALLMSKGRAHIQRKALDGRSGGSYSFDALYLSDAEYEHFTSALRALEGLARSNPPAPERRRRQFFRAIIPDEE